jgi:predicted TIM-barrel fold metal-dependent hydrolase
MTASDDDRAWRRADAGTGGQEGGMVDGQRLVDHHCHGVVGGALDRAAFERLATEADAPGPAGCTAFDSQVGFAIRRWCAPVLELPPHASPEDYLARRSRLGVAEVNRRLLGAAGVDTFLVDTGYQAGDLLGPAEMAAAAGSGARAVIRLEAVAEQVAAGGTDAAGFAAAYAEALASATVEAVGLKSIMAYRYGLDFDPERPSEREVTAAAGRWLARDAGTDTPRLDDPVLLRHVLWAGVDRGLPVQFHVGFGDPDLDLHRCDPARMTGFLRAVQDRNVAVMLLHCYPFHRQAGYLAQVFPHVYLDVGLAVNYVGARAAAVVAESLELAPFHKVLYSSDAYGLPELHYLGAVLFRRAFAEVTGQWVTAGLWSAADADRVAGLIGAGNARRVYRLSGRGS